MAKSGSLNWKTNLSTGYKFPYQVRFKELERENARLKKLVAELLLQKAILKEVASGNW